MKILRIPKNRRGPRGFDPGTMPAASPYATQTDTPPSWWNTGYTPPDASQSDAVTPPPPANPYAPPSVPAMPQFQHPSHGQSILSALADFAAPPWAPGNHLNELQNRYASMNQYIMQEQDAAQKQAFEQARLNEERRFHDQTNQYHTDYLQRGGGRGININVNPNGDGVNFGPLAPTSASPSPIGPQPGSSPIGAQPGATMPPQAPQMPPQGGGAPSAPVSRYAPPTGSGGLPQPQGPPLNGGAGIPGVSDPYNGFPTPQVSGYGGGPAEKAYIGNAADAQRMLGLASDTNTKRQMGPLQVQHQQKVNVGEDLTNTGKGLSNTHQSIVNTGALTANQIAAINLAVAKQTKDLKVKLAKSQSDNAALTTAKSRLDVALAQATDPIKIRAAQADLVVRQNNARKSGIEVQHAAVGLDTAKANKLAAQSRQHKAHLEAENLQTGKAGKQADPWKGGDTKLVKLANTMGVPHSIPLADVAQMYNYGTSMGRNWFPQDLPKPEAQDNVNKWVAGYANRAPAAAPAKTTGTPSKVPHRGTPARVHKAYKTGVSTVDAIP